MPPMAAPRPPNALPLLDALQATLHGALLEVGHSMKNPARAWLALPSTPGLSGPRYNNSSISAGLERFHASLDELEHELCRAKAVVRRDLAIQRADREKREEAERERAAEAAQKMAAERPAAPAPAQPAEDAVMADAAPSANASSAARKPSDPPNKPPAIQINTAATDDAAQTGPATATSTDDLFGRTPTTAGINQADFDSMFDDLTNSNDADGNNASNGGADATGDQGGSGHLDFALLPGLESYANIDNAGSSNEAPPGDADISIRALDGSAERKPKEAENKDDGNNQQSDQQQQQDQNQPQTDNQDFNQDAVQGESTFDDLFNYTEFDLGSGAGGEGGSGGEMFDDDFFNV